MAIDPSSLSAAGGGLLAGGAASIPLGIWASHIAPPQYGAPSINQTGQQTISNQDGAASQTPGDIAASQVNPAMSVGQQAAGSIQGTAQRQASALGMADPSNAVGAINSRLMRNIQGQMGSMAMQYDNQAQVESAERLSQALQGGLHEAQMQNAISQNSLQSYMNQLVARQQIVSMITGGAVGAGGGAAMMIAGAKGKGKAAQGTGATDLPGGYDNVP